MELWADCAFRRALQMLKHGRSGVPLEVSHRQGSRRQNETEANMTVPLSRSWV